VATTGRQPVLWGRRRSRRKLGGNLGASLSIHR